MPLEMRSSSGPKCKVARGDLYCAAALSSRRLVFFDVVDGHVVLCEVSCGMVRCGARSSGVSGDL